MASEVATTSDATSLRRVYPLVEREYENLNIQTYSGDACMLRNMSENCFTSSMARERARAEVGPWCAREGVGRDSGVEDMPHVKIRMVEIFTQGVPN